MSTHPVGTQIAPPTALQVQDHLLTPPSRILGLETLSLKKSAAEGGQEKNPKEYPKKYIKYLVLLVFMVKKPYPPFRIFGDPPRPRLGTKPYATPGPKFQDPCRSARSRGHVWFRLYISLSCKTYLSYVRGIPTFVLC